MKYLISFAINILAFILLLIVLSAAQTSLWLHLFGWFPPPQFFIAVLVFWVLYRHFWETVAMIYLVSIVVYPFTSLPFAQILALNVLTCLGILLAKRRLYWSGATFYMLATGAAVLFFWILSISLSWRYDNNSIHHVSFYSWMTTLLLTMFFSLPLHVIFSLIDKVTDKDHPTEAGTGVM